MKAFLRRFLKNNKTSHPEDDLSLKAQHTRRNIVKMGAILGSAVLANCDGDDGSDHQCFLKGTKIQTVLGQRRVEDLAIGDRLPTVFGGMRPIQWIGRYRHQKSDPLKPWGKHALPVRVARSALAPNVPRADLFLSKGHALFGGGALVTVGSLINGTTIALYAAEEFDELEFFHIKLESHDVIYAEGAPVETLLNIDENAINFAEYFRRYGMPQSEGQPCAPILSYGGAGGEIKSRVRSVISPWFDRRRPIDVIRDRLEERAVALGRRLEAAS